MKYKNLVLIGTSHIAPQSLAEVEQQLRETKPKIVALELDRKRLYALLHPAKKKISLADIRRVGFKGFLFSLLGAWAEKKLGQQVGVSPGAEMLTAYKLAREQHATIALIDQDIELTLKRISQALSWREKWNFVVDIVKAVVFRTSVVEFDLAKVPSERIIQKLMREVKKRYPNLYRVLVTERNEVMAKNLANLIRYEPNNPIVAVVGAGHEKELLALVQKYLKQASSA